MTRIPESSLPVAGGTCYFYSSFFAAVGIRDTRAYVPIYSKSATDDMCTTASSQHGAVLGPVLSFWPASLHRNGNATGDRLLSTRARLSAF